MPCRRRRGNRPAIRAPHRPSMTEPRDRAGTVVVADELRVRASVVAALGHMTLSTEPEAAAEAVVNELGRRTDAPFIGVLQLVSGDRLQPLASYTRSDGVIRGGPALAATRTEYL